MDPRGNDIADSHRHSALPAPAPDVIFRTVDDGAILLHTGSELYFGLDVTGSQVWTLLPPACSSLDQLCEELGRRYPEVSAETLREDVTELLDALLEEGLVRAAGAPD